MTLVNRWSRIGLVGLAALLSPPMASGGMSAEDVDPLVADARTALQHGITFFQEQLAVEGSYVWKYSEDLSFRSGEAVTDENQGWAQPPGTPAIGLAFMQAFEATGRERYLDAASQAARALARTQLTSGGWPRFWNSIPAARKSWCYRVEIKRCNGKGERAGNDERDAATLDDDTTQSALRLLMLVDHALKGGTN